MLTRIRARSTRLFEWWTESIGRHPLLVLTLSFLATAAVLAYTLDNFRVDTDLTDMISDKLPYRKLEKKLQKAFPELGDTIVVVIDAETPEAARSQRNLIAERLERETGLFKRVYLPGSGEFFQRNGLLYLSVKDLEELSDNLANAQPLLGLLSRDFSLRGLFSVLQEITSQEADMDLKRRMIPFLDALSQAFERVASPQPFQLSWQELVVGKETAREMSRQFVILEPARGGNGLTGGEAAIEAVDRIRGEIGLHGDRGVRIRLTGDVALNYENLLTVQKGMALTTLISFLLVAIALLIGLGSGRLVLASLLTLLVGLIWTLGFAMAFIGYLNLISVTFAVLFIGLGIDYGIQFCLRYREQVVSGSNPREALVETAKGIGGSMRLCTVAAAIGFYSFLPTAYVGVSELGLIAGTGMLINLFFTLTVLPAILAVLPLKKDRLKEFTSGRTFSRMPYRHARAIRIGALVTGIGAALFIPRFSFDYNPLNLYEPRSEAVTTIRELFKDAKTSPWTISVLAESAKEAQAYADRLRGLQEVKEAITLADFVPDHQSEKLAIISDMALFMPPGLGDLKSKPLTAGKKVASLRSFEMALKNSLSGSPDGSNDYRASFIRLQAALERFKKVLDGPEKTERALDKLERSLLSNLPALFVDLRDALQAHRITESDLPGALRKRYVSPEGTYRVEVFPRENILEVDALERFVDAVRSIAPTAIDTPVTIREAGKAVVNSFLQATIYAILAITIYLFLELKSVSETGLILLPLTLSLVLTGAASVLLDLPFNFANVIVIPLLIGSGVEGCYLVHRFRTEPLSSGSLLKTSTARALFFSTLTTILSFSTLSFSPHRGVASMGKLLTVCIASLMLTTLFLLPALLASKNRRENPQDKQIAEKHS
jgi:hopanoid biosynthesis associated RND transporter like protein HpnN